MGLIYDSSISYMDTPLYCQSQWRNHEQYDNYKRYEFNANIVKDNINMVNGTFQGG